jgi:threo-3-hydroxy-L-aspartate ammonia-lyase
MESGVTSPAGEVREAAAVVALTSEEDVRAAARRLSGQVLRTPLLPCEALSRELGCRVLLKAENLQHTGSFKARGALNALLARRERGLALDGVVTFSAGNHGAALAFAGRRLGAAVTVFMPPRAVPAKVEAIRRHGGRPVLTEDFVGAAREFAERGELPLLHPFDDLDVIAGQGTVGLEILQDADWVDTLVVPIGGGGLVSGLGATVAALSPATHVVGVEPALAATLAHAVRTGAPAALETPPASLADGLNAPFAGVHTYAHVRRQVHHLVQVGEDDIRAAWGSLVRETRLLVEPSAAVGLAALRAGAVTVPAGGTVVLVISGGNADLGALAAAVPVS